MLTTRRAKYSQCNYQLTSQLLLNFQIICSSDKFTKFGERWDALKLWKCQLEVESLKVEVD